MSAFHNNVLLGASGSQGYQISRSVRLRSSASAYFSRTLAGSGNVTTWTWSGWVKRGRLGANQKILGTSYTSISEFYLRFNSSDCLEYQSYTGGGASNNFNVITTQVFRDPSAWYHITLVWDTTQATAANRVKLYVNGVQITAFSTATYPTQNYSGIWNNSSWTHCIGADPTGMYLDSYLTEVNFIDGQALTPSSFGETDVITGVWKPKKYTGTYGTNGFYLNFSDNSAATAAAIGKDSSGNGNNWTPNNISVTSGSTYDSMIDTPTPYADGGNGRGNYAVLAPVDNYLATITQANLVCSLGASTASIANSTIAMTSGKWYAEFTPNGSVANNDMIGICDISSGVAGRGYGSANGWYYFAGNGNKYTNSTGAAYGATYTNGDVIGVAFDADAGTLTFYKNGTSQGQAYSGLTGKSFAFAYNTGTAGAGVGGIANFGQRPFAYTPPTGFKALNTQNLPDPTIKKGNQYFDVSLWSGNSSTQTITGVNFQPDLVWAKNRNGTYNHGAFDSVRGPSAALYPSLTNAEGTESGVTAFNSNGFTLGSSNGFNGSTFTYVGWQWKKGATPGFDIVTYTFSTAGTNTINHSLGVAPKMIIMKDRSFAYNWDVYHASVGYSSRLILNSTAAAGTGFWAAAPTSTQFSVLNTAYNNNDQVVAYLFAEVAGFSKFGSYTGNGSADGPFVFLGFKPRWVMIKIASGTTGDWLVFDTSRDTYNVTTTALFPNGSYAEATGYPIDILSNGFKLKTTAAYMNGSGNTIIYAAFAENPFKYSLAR